MPIAQVNGIHAYCETRGRGERLLLIPGLGSSGFSYKRIIDGLSAACEVLAVDNRGSGRSDKPDAPYSIEMMAEDAAGVLGDVGGRPAHILGHSMGGRVALALALRHPELVKSLILVSTGPRVPPGTRDWIRRRGAYWRTNPLLRRMDPDPQPYYAFLRQLEASRGFDGTARLGEIHVPTLILQGTRDRLAPIAVVNDMDAGIAGSTLISLPGGHLVFFIQRERCIDQILGFLGGLESHGPPKESPTASR